MGARRGRRVLVRGTRLFSLGSSAAVPSVCAATSCALGSGGAAGVLITFRAGAAGGNSSASMSSVSDSRRNSSALTARTASAPTASLALASSAGACSRSFGFSVAACASGGVVRAGSSSAFVGVGSAGSSGEGLVATGAEAASIDEGSSLVGGGAAGSRGAAFGSGAFAAARTALDNAAGEGRDGTGKGGGRRGALGVAARCGAVGRGGAACPTPRTVMGDGSIASMSLRALLVSTGADVLSACGGTLAFFRMRSSRPSRAATFSASVTRREHTWTRPG